MQSPYVPTRSLYGKPISAVFSRMTISLLLIVLFALAPDAYAIVGIADNVMGSDDDDTLTNSSYWTVRGDIHGKDGDDTITNYGVVGDDVDGGKGNDMMYNYGYIYDDFVGGPGNDTIINYFFIDDDLEGNDGDDTLINYDYIGEDFEGGDGDDWMKNYGYVYGDLNGGPGDDYIFSSPDGDVDLIVGDTGNDYILNQGFVEFAIFGWDGDDIIIHSGYIWSGLVGIEGGDGNDIIILTGGSPFVDGGDGNDIITYDNGEAIELDGGAGTDTLNIYGGSLLYWGFLEFETVNKLGYGSVFAWDTISGDNCDFNIDMYRAATQFYVLDLVDDPLDLDVDVLGGYWPDGTSVFLFNIGAVADFDTETISDTSPYLAFAIANARVTATRIAGYQDFIDPSDNTHGLAGILDGLVNRSPEDLEALFSALDFMPVAELQSMLAQLGPALSYGMQDATLHGSAMFSSAVGSYLRNHPVRSSRTRQADLAPALADPIAVQRDRSIAEYAELAGFAQGLMELVGSDASGLPNANPDMDQRFHPRLLSMDFMPGMDQASGDLGPMQSFLLGDSMNVWARILGSTGRTGELDDFAGWDSLAVGIVGGVDAVWNDSLLAGVYGGWTHTALYFSDQGESQAQSDIYHAGLYGSWSTDTWHVDASLGGFLGWWNADRAMEFSTFSRSAHSEFYTTGVTFTVSGGYDFTWDDYTFGPILGLDYLYGHEGNYTEDDAGSLNLHVFARDYHSLRTMFGGHVSREFLYQTESGDYTFTPEFRALWLHEFLRDSQTIECSLDVGGDFSYDMPGPERDQGLAGLGLTIDGPYGPALFLGYDTVFSQSSLDHTFALGLGLYY